MGYELWLIIGVFVMLTVVFGIQIAALKAAYTSEKPLKNFIILFLFGPIILLLKLSETRAGEFDEEATLENIKARLIKEMLLSKKDSSSDRALISSLRIPIPEIDSAVVNTSLGFDIESSDLTVHRDMTLSELSEKLYQRAQKTTRPQKPA